MVAVAVAAAAVGGKVDKERQAKPEPVEAL
jgi:hypothetical protein